MPQLSLYVDAETLKKIEKAAELENTDMAKKGTPIGPNNLIIAAATMANSGTLITNNENEFSRIDGLEIENRTK